MFDIGIGVQPPMQARTGASLYPPIVAKIRAGHADGDLDYFATAVLVDSNGDVVDGLLGGTKAASRFELAGEESFVFPFTDLSIARAGTFAVRVDVYQVAPGDCAGAALVGQVETRHIAVLDESAPLESPCKSPRGCMEEARRVR